MSRLTALPFRKPRVFDLPPHLLPSPPDTNMDPVAPAHVFAATKPEHEMDPGSVERPGVPPALNQETMGARVRKPTTLSYHNSGLRDSLERTVQRSSKTFVVVIPPSTLQRQHGQLGHTLSCGPRHRLSEGILMPLFPTLYGQLTAIAREFNFPSTAGLCLYLHYMENGISALPRISDDAWQFIWSHVFEFSSPAPSQKPPISGKIEFDIDLRQARWYASWIGSSQTPMSMPSTSLSIGHRQSRVATNDADDQHDNIPIAQQSGVIAPTPRHVPRQLSLVDRFDSSSPRSGSRPASRAALSPPAHATVSQMLSPIFQEEEPNSATNDLAMRVNTWRARASLTPTPLVTSDQPGREPLSRQNLIVLNGSDMPPADNELNLDDFAWSISSAGPRDYDTKSPLSWDLSPSVHLANRIEGSVCLTPSDCTSFGPSDYALTYPVPSSDQLPSPDIAYRMYEDSPPTPSTATSWGAPLSYPPSPRNDNYRPPSVDLGHRQTFSRPETPSSSPLFPSKSAPKLRSIHMVEHGDSSRTTLPLSPTSPTSPFSRSASLRTPYRAQTPDAEQDAGDSFELVPQAKPFTFPYYDPCRSNTWTHVWPYRRVVNDVEAVPKAGVFAFPYYNPFKNETLTHAGPYSQNSTCWSQVWPYRKAQSADATPYNSSRLPEASEDHDGHQCPISVVARPAYPYLYPYLTIYRAVYPHFDLYPAVPATITGLPPMTDTDSVAPIGADLPTAYSASPIKHGAYFGSQDEIRPLTTAGIRAIGFKQPAQYPLFDLYPAVYPHIMLYPPVANANSLLQTFSCLDLDLHGPVTHQSKSKVSDHIPPVYPDLEHHPATCSTENKSWALGKLDVISVRLCVTYPVFDLYPAIYPAFDIYPGVKGTMDILSSDSLSQLAFDDQRHKQSTAASKSLLLCLNPSYPTFNIYPAVYPLFEIYPPLPEDLSRQKCNVDSSGYPHFNLYPDAGRSTNQSLKTRGLIISSAGYSRLVRSHPEPRLDDATVTMIDYPIFHLYPVVYPHFDLYPPPSGTVQDHKRITVTMTNTYPSFNLYPAVYPYFDLWPSIPPPQMSSQPKFGRHAEPYTVVKEDIESRVPNHPGNPAGHLPRKVVKSHRDLHHLVFPTSVVSTPSGTSDHSNPLNEVSLPSSRSHEGLEIQNNMIKSSSSLSPNSRPTSANGSPLPSMSSPSHIRRLPTPPTHGPRLSNAFELMSTLVSESRPLPKRPSSNTFISASVRSSPTQERTVQSGVPLWNRPASEVLSVRPRTEPGSNFYRTPSRSIAEASHLLALERDNSVVQRVKFDDSPSHQGTEAFSIPPRRPFPPIQRH